MEILGVLPMIDSAAQAPQNGDSDVQMGEADMSSSGCDDCYIDCDE